MIVEDVKKLAQPTVIINKNLERFKGRVLFPEKLKKANEILANSEVPKIK